MLSSQSTQVVRATLPIIGAAIGEITPIFYQRLFRAHPELERDLFNRGNQARGDQQAALASAIAAYATLLVAEDGPDPLDVLARIAHKHASLGITEDQYPIVHEHLFAAIVEVLGDAVTPDVANAWDEVYWHMVGALVTIEKRLYAETGVADGEVWRTLVLRRRRQESPDTVSFVLGTADRSALPPARPGQYLSVQVQLPDGARQIRQYSLTHADGVDEWGISVRAVPGGEVSSFLHHNVFEGDEVRVSAPFGELVLEDSVAPLVLISAGIGITPIIGILHYLVGIGSTREVLVLHADRSPAQHAHRQELKELVGALEGATLHRWYEDLGARPPRDALRVGRVDLAGVGLPSGAEVYLCGPLPFMAGVRRVLIERHVPEADIHYEVFGPDTRLALV